MSDLEIVHNVRAPRELVWDVWTKREHVTNWWGPEHFTTPVFESDLRPGGRVHLEMQAPDGTRYPNTGTYEDVRNKELIVIHDTVEIGGAPALEVRTTIHFSGAGDGTQIDVQQDYLLVQGPGEFARAGAQSGWSTMLQKLDRYIASLQAPA